MGNAEKISWEEAVTWLKNQPDQAELVRSCFFDDPLIEAAKRYYSSTEWQAVRQFLPTTPGIALDLGAGRGISSYALACDGWRTTALEPDASDIVGAGAIRALAKETGLSIQVKENWGEQLPFADETFDLVHARQVLHHAHNLERLCMEVGRVLKKGGLFIATREHVISRHEDLDSFLANHPLHNLYGGENAYLLIDYLYSIKSAKLKLIKVLGPYDSPINYYPMSSKDIRDKYKKLIELKFGKRAVNTLNQNLVYKISLKIKTMLDNEPGRLYSFIAKK
jgi:SAM-dependent methyltransferase